MPKLPHKTIIEQYDYINLVEELAWKLFDTVLENQSENREYIITIRAWRYIYSKGRRCICRF